MKSGWSGNTEKYKLEVKIGLILFLILFISYAYFQQPYKSWNVVSRIGLSLSLVEDGTVTINKFHTHTDDKAENKGNFYSDKAPGLSFTALPVLAFSRMLWRLSGTNPHWNNGKLNWDFGFIVYLCTVFTSGLFTAVAALLIYTVSLRIGASISGAVFAMLSFGLGSLAWGWATVFFGHAMAGSCLFTAFVIIIFLNQIRAHPQRDILLGFLAGAFLSWAVVVEYTSAIPVAIIALFGILKASNWGKNRAVRVIGSATIGGIFFVVPLIVYNFIAFDSPFAIGYSNIALGKFSAMKDGFFGITYPRFHVLLMILFSPYRGLIWFSPVLIIAPIGIYSLWHRFGSGDIALTISLIAAYYLLLNSAYYYWDGGWSIGPRHIVPMLPFLCMSFSLIWTDAGLVWKRALTALFFLSFGISLLCVSASMFCPTNYHNPLFDFLIPRFLNGNLTCVLIKMGIPGYVALIPILAVWASGSIFVLNLLHNSKYSL